MTFRKEADLLSKSQHIVNYVRTFASIENSMEPYKEQKRDLRKSYDDNSWLGKAEMRLAVKAYRMMKSNTDFSELNEYVNKLKNKVEI